MESSFDRANELLNPQQPLKVDDKQNLFANTLVIGTVESINQSSGLGLNHTVQSAIDKWAGKQPIDLSTPINIPVLQGSSVKTPGVSIIQPETKAQKIYHAALSVTALSVPAISGIKLINTAPINIIFYLDKISYSPNSNIAISNGYSLDNNGWQDINKVDFWLTDAQNRRIELTDVNTFSYQNQNMAQFQYSGSLAGIAAGDYKLNAISYDKAGAASSPFSRSLNIKSTITSQIPETKPVNIAPKTPVITGIKSSYDANSNLSIDSGSISDGNGWQDISKVSFSLTDATGKITELTGINTFSSQDVNSAKFSYTANLTGFSTGNYQFKAIAYDKAGVASNPFSQSFAIKPVNVAPQTPVITGIKSSYEANSTLSIDPNSYVSDSNGWQDISKVDFWLTNDKGKRIELADATSFTKNADGLAKFNYSTSLNGIASGNYKLNAIAYDKAGLAGNPFVQSFTIKSTNVAPQAPVITGIKSTYEANSVLSIDSGLIADGNGWQDISKVSFSLTDATGKITELTGLNTFASQDVNSAKFSYTANLTGFSAGNYQFKAIAYDKAGVASNPFTQSFAIESANLAPQAPVITGIKSSYEANSTLSIDSGSVSDGNGWQDVSKMDFYLTNAQGQRVELADVNTFSSQDINVAKFVYTTSLNGIAAGNYTLNGIAFDKAGVAGNTFTQVITINSSIKPDVDIKLFDPYNAFSADQMRAFNIAASNWNRIIINDKDISGVLNIVITSSPNSLKGTPFIATAAETYTDRSINSRINRSGESVDINGVDYQDIINVNSKYLQTNPSILLLINTMMHEIGHALGLEHESENSLMNPNREHSKISSSLLSSSSFASLEKLGYKIDRNALIDWG
jgi:predicted Zn-dependent protease